MAYRALLIGASSYDDPAIGDLPFVPEDLRQLHAALTARGFASVEVLEAPRGIIRTTVNARVGGFLREARRDDVLLVVLSGHGQRFEGTDYLIPEDASFAIRPFAECCVAIDWQRELEDSPAAQVVFLIDACREGFARDAMSPAGVQGWGRQRIAAALRRKVGYVYACSPAQVALFVHPNERAADGTSPGESFSLFSRAVAGVVAELPHTMDLDEFHQRVQERVSALHRAYAKPGAPQTVRLATDLDGADFTVLPGPPKDAGVHPWVRSVTGHAAWERTPAGPAREAIQEAAEELAAQLARDYAESGHHLADDPWHDAELATRTQERANFLVRGLDPATAFSPTEAALLALLPLVTQAYWARQAASRAGVLDGTAPRPEQDRFHAFTRSHPRLVRRLAALDQAADPGGDAARIRWWLHHRWLLHQPELYTGGALAALLALPDHPPRPAWCTGALGAARFAHFLQDQRQAPFAHPRDPAPPDTVAASTGHEHMVRQDVVGALAKTAHALAVDPVDLSEIVAEHLGISDAVDTGGLLATLRGSDWRGAGAGRSLNAECGHPAVQIALREHATRTDALLRDISRAAAGGPLHALPAYADADRVRLTGGAGHHLTEGIRFQLAEDRVQELLMGEALYGDRDLAVRELYQNALDALRHRDARTQYLTRTDSGRRLPPWTGAITFRQGIAPDGRGYLECRDNGVGMGVTEIARAFAQGGARFVDLPEYAEEQAEWSPLDPPVQLFPNSRFGIGVLSYFMLADEIEVRTCRFGRDGRPGRDLRVTIAGPGNLFRVEDLGEGDEPGTAVRLSLSRGRAPVSVVDVLERVLWVAQYRTVAEQGARRAVWEAGVLRPPVEVAQEQAPLTSGHPDLWWILGTGRVLADGLVVSVPELPELRRRRLPAARGRDLTESVPHGVIVNFHGPHRLELTVDRTCVTSDPGPRMERLAREAAALAGSAAAVARMERSWLAALSSSAPRVGDAVTAAARRTGFTWQTGTRAAPFGVTGFLPLDQVLLRLLRPSRRGTPGRVPGAALMRCLPPALLRWRLPVLHYAMYGEHLGEAAPDTRAFARPSDWLLLHRTWPMGRWLTYLSMWDRQSSGSQRLSLSAIGRDRLHEAVAQLRDLTDFRSADTDVDVPDVLEAATACGYTAGEVADRFRHLGFRVAPLAELAAAGADDFPLLRPLGDRSSWLPPGGELSPAQVSFSAMRADLPVADAARRLRALGYEVPSVPRGAVPGSAEQRALLDALWQGVRDRPEPADAVRVGTAQLVLSAHACGRSVAEAGAHLRALGFELPAAARLPAPSEDDQLLLAYDGWSPWADRPVHPLHLFAVSARDGRPLSAVVERLRALGFKVPDIPEEQHGELYEAAGAIVSSGRYPAAAARLRDNLHGGGPNPVPDLSPKALLAFARLNRSASGGPQRVTPTPWPRPPQAVLTSTAQLCALADWLGVTRTVAAQELLLSGSEPPPEDPEFERDWAAEQHLGDVLTRRGEPLVDAPGHTAVSLPALCSVAFRHGRPLRDVALLASRLGMRHEAETWFGPYEPAAPAEAPSGAIAGAGAGAGERAEGPAAPAEEPRDEPVPEP